MLASRQEELVPIILIVKPWRVQLNVPLVEIFEVLRGGINKISKSQGTAAEPVSCHLLISTTCLKERFAFCPKLSFYAQEGHRTPRVSLELLSW